MSAGDASLVPEYGMPTDGDAVEGGLSLFDDLHDDDGCVLCVWAIEMAQ